MKTKSFHFQRWGIFLIAMLMTSFSSLAVADLLDDLKEVGDLIKQTVEKAPTNQPAPASTPTKSQQPNTDLTQATSRDLNIKLSRPEYYYERPDLFNSLDFELGEYTIIKPVDKTTFNNLYVPSYKDLPRLALTPSYLHVKTDINVKNAVADRFKNDMLIYHNLRLLSLMSEQVTTENLKIDKSGESHHLNKNIKHLYSIRKKTQPSDDWYYQYVPRYHVQSLVTTLLPKVHNQYFCDPEEPCTSDRFQRSVHTWGGYNKNNEFKSRQAYFSFIETEVPKLQAWANSLSNETYIVGTTLLGEYDFKRKGFELSLFPPRGPYRQFSYAPRDKSKPIFTYGNDPSQAFFLAIDEAKAEALLTQTKTTPNRQVSQLYFVVKGEVYNASNINSDRRQHNQTYAGIHLAYDVTGSIIEFFSDELLTHKIFEANVNP